jgi:hypothetical protein
MMFSERLEYGKYDFQDFQQKRDERSMVVQNSLGKRYEIAERALYYHKS